MGRDLGPAGPSGSDGDRDPESVEQSGGGAGRELYLRKQRETLASEVNLIEIDLLRAGAWTTAVPESAERQAGEFYYLDSLSRAPNRAEFDLYPIPLAQRLPRLAVPLLRGDADGAVDLQSALDRVYEEGRYGEVLDYRGEPTPPLSPAQAAWADALLRAAERRG
ncbi:MAG: DUF4058 family protein [Planctomycetes bacterium]|nr:DUF4058 family protein [Planctomycetota bacterium]